MENTVKKHAFFALVLITLTIAQSHCSSPNNAQEKSDIFPQRGNSGYVGVTDKPDANKFFYWFFEAKNGKADAPLVIWLNGGPGCSSLIDVAVTNGPFTVGADGTLTNNIFSWNQKAHVLYVDQPLGVGYSYGEQTKYSYKAEITREYFYDFFTKWLELDLFKKFKGHPLWFTGISYGVTTFPKSLTRCMK